jgi:hypothetical protein
MSTTYDDMLARATKDMLTDIHEVQPKFYVWCVEAPDLDDDTIDLFLFHERDAAQAFADTVHGYSLWRQEVQ